MRRNFEQRLDQLKFNCARWGVERAPVRVDSLVGITTRVRFDYLGVRSLDRTRGLVVGDIVAQAKECLPSSVKVKRPRCFGTGRLFISVR